MRRMFSEKQIEKMIEDAHAQIVGEQKYRYEIRHIALGTIEGDTYYFSAFSFYSSYDLVSPNIDKIKDMFLGSNCAYFYLTSLLDNGITYTTLICNEDDFTIDGDEVDTLDTYQIIKTNLITGESVLITN